MCGFSVILTPKKSLSESQISKIDKDLEHRGPDSSGVYQKKGFTMIFRRLSILDLRQVADQPMVDEKNQISLVFNGEIYNYNQLKNELSAKGFIFKTKSDTEVILHGYKAWGTSLCKKLEGMFAFVIIDKMKEKAIIARDQYGIKPLYFYKNDNFFYIGSEIKPLKNLVKLEVDKNCLSELFFFRYIHGVKTGYKNVKKIEAGHFANIDLINYKLKIQKYYDVVDTISDREDKNINKNKISIINHLLKQSIIKHTQSDVGFSVQLSGGVDSSFLVALLHQKFGKNLNTYSLRIDDKNFDEIEYRKEVNKLYPTNHIEIDCDSNTFANSFEQTIKSLESPTTHFGCVLLYELCKKISIKNKVVLTGEGADEVFGGYPRYKEIDKIINLKKLANILPITLIRKIPRLNFLEYYKNKNPLKEILTFRTFDKITEIFSDLKFNNKFLMKIEERFDNPRNQIAFYDYKIYLESLLLRQDKVSMAHGVEARVPYVNQPLIDYVNSLGVKEKYDKNCPKIILKNISKKFFNKKFIFREKNGLNLPITKWLLDKKGFGRYIELFDNNNYEILKFNANKILIKKIIDDFRTKKKLEYGKLIAQLINFEIWLRTFKSQ